MKNKNIKLIQQNRNLKENIKMIKIEKDYLNKELNVQAVKYLIKK